MFELSSNFKLQVTIFRREMDLRDCVCQMNLDADGLKKLFSHGLRRLRSKSGNCRDPQLYDEYTLLYVLLGIHVDCLNCLLICL